MYKLLIFLIPFTVLGQVIIDPVPTPVPITDPAFDTPTKYTRDQMGFYLNKEKIVVWNLTDEQIRHLARWHFLDKTRRSDLIYIPVKWEYTDSLFYAPGDIWPPFAPFKARRAGNRYVADIHNPVAIWYRRVNLRNYPDVRISKPIKTGSLVNIHPHYKRINKVKVKEKIEKRLNRKRRAIEVPKKRRVRDEQGERD